MFGNYFVSQDIYFFFMEMEANEQMSHLSWTPATPEEF